MRGNRIPLQIVASRAEYRLATPNPRDLKELVATASAVASGSSNQASNFASLAVPRIAGASSGVRRDSPG